MRANRLLTGNAVRRQWRSVLAIALIAGLGGGFALTAAAGARRASTTWERLRTATLSPDVLVEAREGTDPALLDVMRRQPGVAAAGNFVYTPVAPEPTTPGQNAGAFIAMDRYFGYDVYRPVIEAGRRPDPNRADEVTVNRGLAKLGHFSVGQRVRLRSGFDAEHFTDLGEVTIVGIHKGIFDVGTNAGGPAMQLGYAFLLAHRDQLTLGPEPGGLIRLRDGYAGIARATRQAKKIWGDSAVVGSAPDFETVVVDAVNVQVIALALLAVAGALATAVAAGQALGRLLSSVQPDTAVLRALGLRRRDLVIVGTTLAVIVSAIAAVVALTSAVLASSLAPTGLARQIEPNPGTRVDWAALGAGAAVIIVFLVGVGTLLAWRGARRDKVAASPVARLVPPLAPAAALGVHWTAAPTPGPAATSARSALVAAAVGTAGVIAVLTFAASLSHFLDTDRLYGWEFQGGYVGGSDDPTQFNRAVDALTNDRDITGVARGAIVRFGVGGQQMETWALEPVKGAIHPTLLSGRSPVAADEIVLGRETLGALHLAIGDRVDVNGADGRAQFRVVGTAVFPELGNTSDLANGAFVTADAWHALGGEPVVGLALVSGRDEARVGKLLEQNSPDGYENILPFQPPRVKNIKQVGSIPWLLAAFFSVLALAAVAHALFVSVRHRRRDMAVLRSIGMVRRQLRRAVTAQAATTVIVGAVVGIPVGVAVGRLAWSTIASGLGVLNRPVVQLLAIPAVLGVGVVAAVAVALIPAIRAGRLRPATLLRTE